MSTFLNRRGARKLTLIPQEVLQELNKGNIETVNLIEWLAVNHLTIVKNQFPKLNLAHLIAPIEKALTLEKKKTTLVNIKLVGRIIYEDCKKNDNLKANIKKIATHQSDIIRCYSAYLIALDTTKNTTEKLENSKHLIKDSHFGVREIIWMALRPCVEKNLSESLGLLEKWTGSSNENIRRFTTEVIRPRGVWCKHLKELKEKPEMALPILEKLKADKSKYVQNSVANWLNDASKTKANFVKKTCNKWELESNVKETKYIVKRALRSLRKD